MKTHQLIFLKDWPELKSIHDDWMEARKNRSWVSRFMHDSTATDSKYEPVFVKEVRRVVTRKIPIGRNPDDYKWLWHDSIHAISWGPK